MRPSPRPGFLARSEGALETDDHEALRLRDEAASGRLQPLRDDVRLQHLRPQVETGIERSGRRSLESSILQPIEEGLRQEPEAAHLGGSADEEQVDLIAGHVGRNGRLDGAHCVIRAERGSDRLGDPLGVAVLRAVHDEDVHI